MAMQHHPLSNAALGLFLVAETQTTKSGNAPANFKTMFLYQKGYVILDNNWKYREHLYKNGTENTLTEGTNDNPSSNAFTGEDKADYHVYPGSSMYDSIDSKGNIVDFKVGIDRGEEDMTGMSLYPEDLGYLNIMEQNEQEKEAKRYWEQYDGVSPRLDQHSIDGMDDMLEEMVREEFDIRSEADEASTEDSPLEAASHYLLSDKD